ncbi:peptidoglycan-associated lipoprotein Pal [uncultured Litoreibacter sp.]|uniref:peptidoglycan-associated lipoprotein Pal n=1 Tax=uncultured Litoreibacter sp. TaxID=1392394 RepID=UPI00262B826E|nr:peptidoglycan-associated lipoprotein Pal [uncultured Litoreibacter sp.]
MKTLSTALLLTASLGLSACSGGLFNQNDRLGTDGGAGNGIDNSGITTGALAPNSVAYFNQTIGDRVLFAVDTSTLTDQGRATLSQQASWLNTNTSFTAIIEGHADEQGTREYNLALGARRAAAVRDYLVSQGVADARMRTVTFGKERPIEVCSTEVCYAKNRRAVTVIGAGATS